MAMPIFNVLIPYKETTSTVQLQFRTVKNNFAVSINFRGKFYFSKKRGTKFLKTNRVDERLEGGKGGENEGSYEERTEHRNRVGQEGPYRFNVSISGY